ncbi:hypothetical protein [Gimesia sp.]|uniref:hypothetical protein n=1 Tax=Gimesia sp. TaxID=2024833 RepID=UPI003A910A2C
MTAENLDLPHNYLLWLDSLEEDAYVEFDEREWEIASREELRELLEIDDYEVAYIDQANLYVKLIQDITGDAYTMDDEGNRVPFSLIGTWLTIGYDNEDLLCVDPADNFAVWGFYPSEGGDVEKLADSLDDFLEGLELLDE